MNDCPLIDGVQLVWYSDFWDGPLAGLARHAGRNYWFAVESFDPDSYSTERRYLLYALTDEELASECAHHRRFQRYVGTHMDGPAAPPCD